MTGIRQRMRRRSGAENPDPAAAAPEVQAADGAAATAEAPATSGVTPPDATAPATPDATPSPATTQDPAATPAPGEVPGAAPAPGTAGATPAEVVAPAAEPDHPGFATRGRLRRRLRYLRRVRELGYRDLGGLVFDQHRFARPNEALVQTKVGALAQIDGEVRALERALDDKRAIAELREAGIAACPRCGAIHGSESRYCPTCGLALSGPTEMAPVHAPPAAAGAPAATTPVGTGPPTAVPIAPVPVPPATSPAPASATPVPAPSASAPTPTPAAPTAPPSPTPAPQDTIHLRSDAAEQPTTVLRAADVGATPVTGGDPLTGPRPAERPDLKSGDPLAGRPPKDPKAPESEPRP